MQKVEADKFNMLSDKVITDHFDSCEDVCKWQAVSTRYKNAEINEKLKEKLSLDPQKKWTFFTACQECQHNKSGHTDLARKGRIRVGSMPEMEYRNTWLKINLRRNG